MLLKMLPGQISAYWDYVKYSIEQALPPVVGEGSDKMINILSTLMTGEMQCWVVFRREEGQVKVIGFVLTTVSSDYCSKTRNLLLYTICTFEKTHGQDWLEGLDALKKFAKKMNCSRITAFTKQENLMKLAEGVGGDASYHFISVPI